MPYAVKHKCLSCKYFDVIKDVCNCNIGCDFRTSTTRKFHGRKKQDEIYRDLFGEEVNDG